MELQSSYTNNSASMYDPVVTAFEFHLREEIAGLSKIGKISIILSVVLQSSYVTLS